MQQRTIKTPIEFSGISLHKGQKTKVKFSPARPDTGIVFRVNGNDIRALAFCVSKTELSTTLGSGSASIQTVEHLMAAISGLFIDNMIIEVSSDELPIMDGSASPFIYILNTAGIVEQPAPKKFIRITKDIILEEGDKRVSFHPSDDISYSIQIDFSNRYIKNTPCQIDYTYMGPTDFIDGVSRARTFGFVKDIEYLKSKNLALGGSVDNAIVLDDYGMLNDDELRYSDEFVRHKLLDAIGDLRLLGYNFIGKFIGHKPGHALNNKLARLVLTSGAYELVTCAYPRECGDWNYRLSMA